MGLTTLCQACAMAAVLISPLPPERPGGGAVNVPAPVVQDIDDRTLLEMIIADLQGDAPVEEQTAPPENQPGTAEIQTLSGPRQAPVPIERPGSVLALAEPRPRVRQGQGLCGDPRLEGETIAPVSGPIAACGIAAPVRLTGVAGVRLTAPAQLNCRTARTFADWLTGPADRAAREDLGAGIARVRVMASYACRTRNHRAGARLSEHAFGRAIDIGGVTLEDGRRIAVLNDWNKGRSGRFLRRIWNAACGPFKTVLGPEADRHHLNHFHFDTAQRRSSFCR